MLTSSYRMHVPSISLEEVLEAYPELQRNCKRLRTETGSKFVYDFTKSEHQYAYNERVVQHYFRVPGYRLSRANLCPGITGRLEYLRLVEHHLIEGLEVHDEFANNYVRNSRWIMDIGTGSSVVYPVLGQRMNPRNRYIASEINKTSLKYARNLVENNHLDDKIHLIKGEERLFPVQTIETIIDQEHGREEQTNADGKGEIIEAVQDEAQENNEQRDGEQSDTRQRSPDRRPSILYTVCNPPFYSSPEELLHKENFKNPKPNDLSASDNELYFPGGETEFIARMVDESVDLRDHAAFHRTWFTVLVGVLQHVEVLKRYIHSKGITNVFVGSFGSTTRRWVLAWNWDDRVHAVPQKYHEKLSKRSSKASLEPERPDHRLHRREYDTDHAIIGEKSKGAATETLEVTEGGGGVPGVPGVPSISSVAIVSGVSSVPDFPEPLGRTVASPPPKPVASNPPRTGATAAAIPKTAPDGTAVGASAIPAIPDAPPKSPYTVLKRLASQHPFRYVLVGINPDAEASEGLGRHDSNVGKEGMASIGRDGEGSADKPGASDKIAQIPSHLGTDVGRSLARDVTGITTDVALPPPDPSILYLITSEPVWWRKYRRHPRPLPQPVTLRISSSIVDNSRPSERSLSVQAIHTPSPHLESLASSLCTLFNADAKPFHSQ